MNEQDVERSWTPDKIAVEGIMRVGGVDADTAIAVWRALDPLIAHIVRADAVARADGRESLAGEVAARVTFQVQDDWPTPNHCRRAADALDALSSARYGDILRAYALAEDRRFDEHGPLRALVAPTGHDPESGTNATQEDKV